MMVLSDFADPDKIDTCSCNSPGCVCDNEVDFSGEVCDMCQSDVHKYTRADDFVDDEYNEILD